MAIARAIRQCHCSRWVLSRHCRNSGEQSETFDYWIPFFAQGAAQAIEDAFVLAHCLRNTDRGFVQPALQRYEAIRRPRTSQVQVMSRGREVRNHLPDGPEQRQRDTEFANGDPLRQSAWLYGYDPQTDLLRHV